MIISEKKKAISVCSAEEVVTMFRAMLEVEDEIGREREHFWVTGLNTKNIVKYTDLVSLGSLNAAIVHPREVFRYAVSKGVSAVIMCHNHPSGDTNPSQEDILLTKRLTQAGEVLGIKVLDHIIIGEGHFSFRDKGLIAS